MRNLWPNDLRARDVRAPVVIVREQAAYLGQMTQNVIEGEVTKRKGVGSSSFEYVFYLYAPALDGFRYRLFTFNYGVEMYPVAVDLPSDIAAELGADAGRKQLIANDEEEFLEVLQQIFGAEKTRIILSSLLAQARDLAEA